MVWTYHTSQQCFHIHPTRYYLRQKKKKRSQSKFYWVNWRLRHWPATETYAGKWSGAQLHSNPMSTPGHRTDDNGDEDTAAFMIIFKVGNPKG